MVCCVNSDFSEQCLRILLHAYEFRQINPLLQWNISKAFQ